MTECKALQYFTIEETALSRPLNRDRHKDRTGIGTGIGNSELSGNAELSGWKFRVSFFLCVLCGKKIGLIA
jgi:hypothetical protein